MSASTINGNVYSYVSLRLSVAGVEEEEIDDISYKTANERGEGRGTKQRKYARTRGDVTEEASITMSRRSAMKLAKKLGKGFMNKEFDIEVTFAEEGEETQTDTIQGCTIAEWDQAFSRSSDPLKVTIPLSVGKILYDGLEAV